MTRSSNSSGQTVIALLIFMAMAIMVTTIAATITVINIRANNTYSSGEQALANAESGAEDALRRLLRDPTYAGQTVVFAEGTATISISGTTVKTIVSHGNSGDNYRTVTVTVSFIDNMLAVTSWSETP